MLGRNVSTVPTPEMAPSHTRLTTASEAPRAARPSATQPLKRSSHVWKTSFTASPRTNVSPNTAAMMRRKTGMDHTRLVRTRSARSVASARRSRLNTHSAPTPLMKS